MPKSKKNKLKSSLQDLLLDKKKHHKKLNMKNQQDIKNKQLISNKKKQVHKFEFPYKPQDHILLVGEGKVKINIVVKQ